MNDKLSPDALIEAALLTQTEPLSEKAMRDLCIPPLSQDKLIDGVFKLFKQHLNVWAACRNSVHHVIRVL